MMTYTKMQTYATKVILGFVGRALLAVLSSGSDRTYGTLRSRLALRPLRPYRACFALRSDRTFGPWMPVSP